MTIQLNIDHMETNPYVKIDINTINKFSEKFLLQSKPNPFYDKKIFFTQDLRASKYIEFQIIGNLGGWVSDNEFNSDTDYYIIADKIISDLKSGKNNKQIEQLEERLNAKGKKYVKLKILSETAFLNHVQKRCNAIGDKITLKLVNQVQ